MCLIVGACFLERLKIKAMDIFLKLFFGSLGYLLIWMATHVNRNPGSYINPFSKHWFIQLFLILTGALILINTQ